MIFENNFFFICMLSILLICAAEQHANLSNALKANLDYSADG